MVDYQMQKEPDTEWIRCFAPFNSQLSDVRLPHPISGEGQYQADEQNSDTDGDAVPTLKPAPVLARLVVEAVVRNRRPHGGRRVDRGCLVRRIPAEANAGTVSSPMTTSVSVVAMRRNM